VLEFGDGLKLGVGLEHDDHHEKVNDLPGANVILSMIDSKVSGR
jgi:hypothetical protein